MPAAKRSAARRAELAGDVPHMTSSADFYEEAVSPPRMNGQRASKKKSGVGFNLRGVADVLVAEGMDPAYEMVRVLKEKVPLRDRNGMMVLDENGEPIMQDLVDVDVKLLQYTQPKLKAVEVTGKNGGPITVANLTTEQAEKIAREFLLATGHEDDADD